MNEFISALFYLLSACGLSTEPKAEAPINVIFNVGDTGEEFLQKNNLPVEEHVMKQPAGLNFYRHRWAVGKPGKVFINHGEYGFTIPHALSVTGTEDIEFKSSGLSSFSINFVITDSDLVHHDEARRKTFDFLKRLLERGWRRVIFYEDPRLAGEDAFKYFEDDNFYGMPLDYLPTLEQWMTISSANWYLYADNMFLDIIFQRDMKRMVADEPGAYLFSLDVRIKEEKAKDQFEGDDRDHWKELWIDKIKSLKKIRYAKEKELIKRGFTIYTDYEDPKIHPADPVEP